MLDFAAAREAMVDCQVRPADVTRYSIIEAMLWAPRERFVPKSRRAIAYAEAEVEVAPGRALLEPRVFAKMLEAAAVTPKDLVLDLAPATGYSTAVLARLAEAVVAVEPDGALARKAQQAMADLEVDNAVVASGDPTEGDAAHGPYDVIFLGGAVERIPETLFDQLGQDGRLIAILRQGAAGRCALYTRTASGISDRTVFDATAPLIAGFEAPPAFEF
ncbi:MAG: protein-L-isoaspartate O-methyltransferase [Pseudomonadota bacterium]